MKNLIETILEIDKDGVKRVDDANAEAHAALDEANAKKAEMELRFNERISTRLKAVEESYARILSEDIAEIDKKRREREDMIDSVMREKGAKWEAEILERIIGEPYGKQL